MPPDLKDRRDVQDLVVAFYKAAFADPLIGPIFTDVAKLDLGRHLPIMCDFWQTVLFNAGLYRRNALQPHVLVHDLHPLLAEHFGRWLAIWVNTVDSHFRGEKAELAKLQAERIAGSMQRRLEGRSGSAHETLTLRRRPSEAEEAKTA